MVALVRQLGDEEFAVRAQAARELILIGPPAINLLRQAAEHPDPEVQRLAESCLRSILVSPGAALPVAAVRLLRERHPEGSTAALLGYVPFTNDEQIEEAILEALSVLGVRGGKCDAALRSALSAADPRRRAAAALVVGRHGGADDRPHVRRLLGDTDARVRLRAAQGLVAGRELHAVGTLVSLLGDAPLNVAFQAEDLLSRLAGDRAPRVELESSPSARRRCAEAWAAWWRGNQDRVDLTRAPDLVVLNPGRRAQEAAEQFFNAFVGYDVDTLKRMAELPFYDAEAGRVIRTRDGLEKLFQEALNFRDDSTVSFQLSEERSFREYHAQLPQTEQNLLARYRRPEVRIVGFEFKTDDEAGGSYSQRGAILIRVGNGGTTRVIGVGAFVMPLLRERR